MEEIRTKVRSIILGIVGFIDSFLVIRILLDLLNADPGNFLVKLINEITDFLINPFLNVVNIPSSSGLTTLNADAIVALIAYTLGGIAISEIVTAFLYDDAGDILQNLIDGIFKILEFLVFLRIVFYLFDIGTATSQRVATSFVDLVFTLTEWTQLLGIRPQLLTEYMDWSAVVALIILVIIDISTERFLTGLFKEISKQVKGINVSMPKLNIFKDRSEPLSSPPPPAFTPPQQNIIVNVPMPQYQPPAPQPVNVYMPPPQQPMPPAA